MKNKSEKRQTRRLPRWKKYLGITACVLLIMGLIFYWLFEPVYHFSRQKPPVLANPRPAQQSDSSGSETAPVLQEQSALSEGDFNVLLLGTDARGDEVSRTDVIMAAHVSPKNKKVQLLSIPRDTRVLLEGIGYTKINHAHTIGEKKGGNASGTGAMIQAVSDLLKIPIHYYVKTDFKGFQHVIDTIGGIDIELNEPVPLSAGGGTVLEKGEHHFSGKEALQFVRERYALPDGDFGRQKHQAMVLKAMANQLLKPTNVPKLPGLWADVKQDMLDTNFSNHDLVSLGWLFAGMGKDRIYYSQIPGRGEKLIDALMNVPLYFWVADQEKLTALVRETF
ncbi:LCP family protein [Paenibacillus larvae]|uniref:Transcriptional regulator LytR n=4 Tax=Paenibacillus larvae TaxID=1464 RepID=V9W7D0_9BACL|nr:LCP family protein [Paenibacillus larvae]AHD05814.1 transcriptional regulator LytR [Paenibacillus larvae subsp. larvae DSM 25430]AVF22399.1 transcriptional regulator LytR [Paenibacillus larvae subsp. larvae]AVF26735.1 transcriptional regulator LytR [Paenibacillus larvae subsp. larvae]AVF31482.1 transcriptional regulator LytR [Paenibacillus larvae subsp. larvae]AVG12352.1 transcriptional regulator LytR [Paenibacillus larvae subsp. larvae DSM 25430]